MKQDMRYLKIFPGILLVTLFFAGCKSKLEINAPWKDISVVYGLLNQNDSVHYFKITKAFLGNGNAYDYAKIPDSSYYRDSLDIRMEEYLNGALVLTDDQFPVTYDTTKVPGIFYAPVQMLFKTTLQLKQNATYKLVIRNKKTGKIVSATTPLVHQFEIAKPQAFDLASYLPGKTTAVQWTSAVGGRRYQLDIRFHYIERLPPDTTQHDKYLDWIVFQGLLAPDANGGRALESIVSGDAFYTFVGGHVPENTLDMQYSRLPRDVEYIFSVYGDDMNTYIEVTEPSSGIVQEKPSYTNITNGLGLFSCTYDNRKDNPLILRFSDKTLAELKVNSHTANWGF